jgi:hypothetical protein
MSHHGSSAPVTRLELAAVAPSTLKEYAREVEKFLEWLKGQGVTRVSGEEHMDVLALTYIEHTYAESKSRQYYSGICKMISGLKLFAPRELSFTRSSRALQGWDRLHPATPKQPVPRAFVHAMATLLIQRQEIHLACFMLLMFYGKLRFNEATQISLNTLCAPEDFTRQGLQATSASILLPKTKTGKYQVALIHHPIGIAAVRRLKTILPPNYSWPPLWKFNTLLRSLSSELGVNVHLTSHCFRRGGAADDLLCRVPITEIKQHGRWTSDKSLKTYLDLARYLLSTFPPCTHPCYAACSRDMLSLLTML